MATIESRIERIETEIRFRFWVRWQRIVEDMNTDEMEMLASTGQWSDRPEPAPGASPLDAMDRTSLLNDGSTTARCNSMSAKSLHTAWCGRSCFSESVSTKKEHYAVMCSASPLTV